MLKLNEIVVYDLEYVTIMGLRLWFCKEKPGAVKVVNNDHVEIDSTIRIYHTEWMFKNYIDTKIIAKVAMIKMELN